LIHITNGLPISKYELLSLMKEVWKKENIVINPVDGKAVDKSLKTIRSDFNYEIPSYYKMLQEQNKFMLTNKSLYNKTYF